MFDHLKRYNTFALYMLLLSMILSFSAHLMAAQEVVSQDETTQFGESVVEDNEQSDEKEVKKPTFAQSWRKVFTLRWKELGKADAWNIGAPIAGAVALGWLSRYFPQNIVANNDNNNPGQDNPGIPPHVLANNYNLGQGNPVSLADLNAELPHDVQSNIALRRIDEFLLVPKILPEEHTKWTNAVAMSDDKVVTVSSDHTAKIWNTNGQLLHTLRGHTDVVLSVAIHGDKVVTGSQDHTAKVWNIQNGKLLYTLAHELNDSSIDAVAINDENVVTGDGYGTVNIWNVHNGESLLSVDTDDAVTSVAISGDILLTGLNNGTVDVWNIHEPSLHVFKAHNAAAWSLAISGNLVVTGSGDGTAKVWDIDGQLQHTLAGHTASVFSVSISNDKVVTGSYDRTAKIWDLTTGQLRRTLKGHTSCTRFSVAIKDDKVITGSYDKVLIWPLSIDLQAPELKPFACMEHTITMPQADFIARALNAMQAGQDFMIALPEKLGEIKENESQEQADGRIYFTFPDEVREYLRTRLIIRK